MRTISVMTILLPFAALAACGSEESARSTFRQASIDGCMSAASGQPTPAAMANFDWNRLCSCATDKIMDGKSAADLAHPLDARWLARLARSSAAFPSDVPEDADARGAALDRIRAHPQFALG